MAQRTGADSLIAPRAKIASAGAIPALAVALACILPGCGGGSGSSTASAPATQGQGAAQGEGSPAAAAQKEAKAKPGAAGHQNQDPPKASPPTGAASKQGPRIAGPKGPTEPAPTPAQKAQATVADIALSSPALRPSAAGSEATLPAAYTCDGKNESPPLRWKGVPPGSSELVLFAIGTVPVSEALFFGWAVAGLDPGLEAIDAGTLPKGAVMGKNGFGHNGYEICPPQGQAETYVFALYALPEPLSPTPGFDPAALRKRVLEVSGDAGLMAVGYSRGG